MDKFYLSFLKTVLRVKKSTPSCFVYGELGVYPLFIERQMRVLSYWAKIISPENLMSPLVSKVYEEMFNLTLSNPEVVTWASLVRDMLNKYGLGNY